MRIVFLSPQYIFIPKKMLSRGFYKVLKLNKYLLKIIYRTFFRIWETLTGQKNNSPHWWEAFRFLFWPKIHSSVTFGKSTNDIWVLLFTPNYSKKNLHQKNKNYSKKNTIFYLFIHSEGEKKCIFHIWIDKLRDVWFSEKI